MEENQSFLELQVDKEATENLTEAARWGKLLGIMVIGAIGLLLLLIILMGKQVTSQFLTTSEMQGSDGDILIIGLIGGLAFIGAIVGILMSFLIKGTNRIRHGIIRKDQILFNNGLANLKNFFAMYGILGIIGLLLSMLGLLNQ
jgi:hypothetical protein